MDKRWYEQKSPVSVGAREICITLGRLIVGALGLFTLQHAYYYYPMLGTISVFLVSIFVIMVLHKHKVSRALG
jgi:hypothetical protein